MNKKFKKLIIGVKLLLKMQQKQHLNNKKNKLQKNVLIEDCHDPEDDTSLESRAVQDESVRPPDREPYNENSITEKSVIESECESEADTVAVIEEVVEDEAVLSEVEGESEAESAESEAARDEPEAVAMVEAGVEQVAQEQNVSPQAEKPSFEGEVSVLRVDDLHKFFRRKHAVKGVSFSMKQGEVVGLLGPNGAGKTTSFYMIVGFYRPNKGNIYLNDICLTTLPMYKRARAGISYLPQEASVFRKLTVEQNIYSILQMRKDITKQQKKERLEFLLDEFGVAKNRYQQAYTLSGGERRRTEIARALAIEPKFLLLDEPFAGIDPIAVHDIKSIIRLLARQGIGILITDHNVRDTLEITDRAYIIGQGEIVEQGSKEKILNSEIARKIYLGEEFRM